MKKYVKVLISFLVVLSLSATPGAVSLANTEYTANALQAHTNSVKSVDTLSTSEMPETTENAEKESTPVELNEETLESFIGADDKFYEPEEESITVLGDDSAYVNDAVSVFFREGTADSEKSEVIESVGGEIAGEIGFMNQYEVKIQRRNFEEISEICDKLMENDSVEFASCILANQYEPDYVPDDPWSGYINWGDNANSGSLKRANWWIKAIDADKAWDYEEKFNEIKIGIVDSGFYTEHEELQGKITFPREYYEKNNAPTAHGTHVAGIIAAERDNGIGISGIVKDCELVCVDWEADESQGQKWNSEVRIMTGFINAVRAGARVINFSLGSSGNIRNGTTDRYKFVKDTEALYTSYIMAKLIQRGYDFICCQSAGNGVIMQNGDSFAVDASNNGTFCTITEENAASFVLGVTPKDIVDRIIIVSSAMFNRNDTYVHSPFSNGGDQVSISAPGSEIYSTYYSEDGSSNYGYMSGTSMAAPIVTAVASLVWSINSSFTGSQVKHFVCDVENTKYLVEDNNDKTHLPTGSVPMVNALLAVQAALKAIGDTGIVDGEVDSPTDPEDENINVEIVSDESGEVYRILTDEDGKFTARLPEGSYTIRKVDNIDWEENFTVYKDETTALETIATGNFTAVNAEKLVNVISEIVWENS